MSRIQFDLKMDLPRAIGSAWKVPIGRCGVLLQVVEVRRVVPVGDAVEDAEMDLHRLLDLIEDRGGCSAAAASPAVFSTSRSLNR